MHSGTYKHSLAHNAWEDVGNSGSNLKLVSSQLKLPTTSEKTSRWVTANPVKSFIVEQLSKVSPNLQKIRGSQSLFDGVTFIVKKSK